MPKLSLVVPCYNEEKYLASCIQRCLKLTEHGIELELVIVDDCSKDESFHVAQEMQAMYPEFIVIARHAQNRGKGAALRTGFQKASGDFVGVQDADREYDPLDYLKLVKILQENNADVVYGSRYLRQDSRRVLYFWHTWMNKILTLFSNMFTNLDITDMETCYKLFCREAIEKIVPQLKENRFGFEPEVTALVAKEKMKIYECPVNYEPRSYEEGKKIGWKDGVAALYCILHYSAHYAPVPMQLLLYFFIGAISALVNIGTFFALVKFDIYIYIKCFSVCCLRFFQLSSLHRNLVSS